MTSANVKETYSLQYYTGVSWVDITTDAMREPISCGWGIPDNNPLSLMASTGSMTFTLDNVPNVYIPETGTTLTGWGMGTLVQLVMTFDSTSYIRFKGRVSMLTIINEIKDRPQVSVTCLDWMEYAAKFPLTSPQVVYNVTADQAITTIVNAMPVKPTALALDTGQYCFPSLFDAVDVDATAYAEFAKLANSEMGYIYLQHDRVNGETLVFENSAHRNGLTPLDNQPKMKADSGFLTLANTANRILFANTSNKIIPNLTDTIALSNMALSMGETYGDNIINRVKINTYPKTVDASPVILYKLAHPILIKSGETKTVKGAYNNPTGGKKISGVNMVTPVATTDYLFNTASDGSGTDITAQLTVSCSYSTNAPVYTLTSAYAGIGWLIKMTARGYGVYQDNTLTAVLESTASEQAYGYRDLSIEQTYQQDTDLGAMVGNQILDANKAPHVKVNSFTFNANYSNAAMLSFLNSDVGSLVQIVDTQYAINDWLYVQGVSFTVNIGGQVNASWILKKAASIASGGLTPVGVEIGHLATDAIDFGGLNILNTIKTFTIAAWIKINHDGNNQSTIISNYDATTGFVFQAGQGGGANYQLVFYNNNMSPDWYVYSVNAFVTGALTHVVVTGDMSISSAPKFYVNGSSIAVSSFTGSAGYYRPALGNRLFLGNMPPDKAVYGDSLDGIIKDARIYNRILSAAEVTTLYNGGTPSASIGTTSGLIFQSPCVRTAELTAYTNLTLTSENRVLDNISGLVGTPNGSPITRGF